MAEDRTAGEHHSFRLTGEIDGARLTLDLEPGEHVLGASYACDLPLVTAGVSRRHASLRVENGTLVVRDLGSKNGTFVNGRKIDSRSVDEGDWIGFGPAVLHVVRIHADDARVAISLGSRRRWAEIGDSTTQIRSVARRAEDEPPSWLELVNALTDELVGRDAPDPAGALELLREGIGADSVCSVVWDGGNDSVVEIARGSVVAGPDLEPVRDELAAAAESAGSGAVVRRGSYDGDRPLVWAIAAPPESAPCALVVGGDFPHRRAAGPLIEATLRMLLHARSEPFHLSTGPADTAPPDLSFSPRHVIGRSPAMAEVYGQLRQLLRGDIPVLITGETGVGKEHIAEILHASSSRCRGPFVAVNCAAIPSELLEAELFGIESGVATGVTARQGKFQLARGGVLFLDEIGDMSLELQAKLLRALQAREVHPLGAKAPEPIDVRIVTATNTDLQDLIAKSRFRRDLYYRVAGVTIRVPPLRARRDDIPAFVEHFMRLYAEEIDKPVRGITVKALGALAAAPWPGNIRELEHEVRRLIYLCPENEAIDSSMLSPAILSPSLELELDDVDAGDDLDLEAAVAAVEKRLISAALGRTNGNRSQAAKLLGISRNGLALKMERLGLP